MDKRNDDETWIEATKKERDTEWRMHIISEDAEKTEKIANFSLGFSIFTLIFITFVELVIKK